MEELERLTFEAAMARLEVIVNRLERGEVPLEESIELFQEGMSLSRLCGEKLNQIGQKMEVIMQENGKWQKAAFLTEEESS